MAKKPVMLMILDGWGLAPAGPYNAAAVAKTPNLDRCFAEYPHTRLDASGEDVGLPAGQIGNSEVGHLNIGSGRIIYQDLSLISHAIKEGSFFKNQVLLDTIQHAKEKGSALHLMGLFSDGGVHSHIDHLKALLEMAKEAGLEKVFVHTFLDGRDVPPQSAIPYVQDLEAFMQEKGIGCFATVSGRYYAMDRDKRWERLEKAYRNMVLRDGAVFPSAEDGIKASYEAGVNDEFVIPFCVAQKGEAADAAEKSAACIRKDDSIIFYNFRPDRAREITRALHDEDFPYFARPEGARPVYMTGMTQYDATIDIPTAYPPEHYEDTFGEVLAKNGLKQLRIAETEKYAHVTFFFNGGVEEPNEGEDRILIPSPKVATYDLQPEMSAPQVTEALLKALDEDKYDVVFLNFANPDMVGHTG
ncbi:MAG: 2,3-bisphosphoglycerate-independent phosphoglycerate mutase, partial [Acidaminococcaceae bacterium]|nr:2,3-bisphosphoglycerate-independent phosphoglycerate mutase [Acidaminococcaceae bacterium]